MRHPKMRDLTLAFPNRPSGFNRKRYLTGHWNDQGDR